MKTLVSIIALISISFFTQAQSNVNAFKKLKDGKHVVINAQKHRKVIHVKNGKLHGDLLVYNEANNLIEKHQYFKGERHGKWTFWDENGQITAILQYQKGKKHGKWELFHKNGKRNAIMSYNQGVRIDTWKNFDQDDNLLSKKEYGQTELASAQLKRK